MNSGQIIEYLRQQRHQLQSVIGQLEEIQVAFNAQFDVFSADHDATLDQLSGRVIRGLDSLGSQLREAIEARLVVERGDIDLRREQIRSEYLPRRRQAADDLQKRDQEELAQLRVLNPQLDAREEALKAQKTELEARLSELNEAIRNESRGLGVVMHFPSISSKDRERQRIVGRLEGINESLRDLRHTWQDERRKVEKVSHAYQEQWQLESMAVARLEAELDQLEEPSFREDLALRRAVRHTLDGLTSVDSDGQPEMLADLARMVELNARTDEYHEGLASVGGLIGLLRGIDSGTAALVKSLEGLQGEEGMHSAYLRPLNFTLPPGVEAFHRQWPIMAEGFADETVLGSHPIQFSSEARPLVEGPLSQQNIEAMFQALGSMIGQATAAW